MPRIRVEESPLGAASELDSKDGGRLLDLCDQMRAPIPFSCRSATCGTCRVDVLEGESLLEPPSDEEREVLGYLGHPTRGRLSCVARVRAADGLVRLRVASD